MAVKPPVALIEKLSHLCDQLLWKLNANSSPVEAELGELDYNEALSLVGSIEDWCIRINTSVKWSILEETGWLSHKLSDLSQGQDDQDGSAYHSVVRLLTLLRITAPVAHAEKSIRNLDRTDKRKADPAEVSKYMQQLRRDHPEKKYAERVTLTAKHFKVSETVVKHTHTQ